MKVNVNFIPSTIELEGPQTGYLNVYAVRDGERLRYVTGKKSYASASEASRNARPAPGWTRVGIVPVEHYRNHVNANLRGYQEAMRLHIINDIDTFLARVTSAAVPNGPAPLNTRPAPEMPISPTDGGERLKAKPKAKKAAKPKGKPVSKAKPKVKAPAKAKAKVKTVKRKV